MLILDGGGGGTYVPTKKGKGSDLEQEKTPGTMPWKIANTPESPEVKNFLSREQRAVMLANNQWRPKAQQQPDDTWSKMPQSQRDKLTLLPTYSYKMTPFEENRLRGIEGEDFPSLPPEGYQGYRENTPQGGGSRYVPEPPPVIPATGVERVANPVYSQALTWEEYDKLSDADRAVVDFNGDFLKARAKDFENKEVYAKTATPEQRARYDEDIAAMFGGQGGSETYAPNVLSLLKSVDFDAVGQDLDEYLNLDRLITADEMKAAKVTGEPLKYGSDITPDTTIDTEKYAAIRTPENLAALDQALTSKYAAKITKVMQDGYLRLKDIQSSMESARSTQTLGYGGIGYNEPMTPGFPVVITPGSDEATKEPQTLTNDQQMGLLRRGVYEFAIDKRNKDSAPMFQWLAENKLTEDERSSLWEYVRERLAQDREWGVPEKIKENIPDRRTYDEAEKFLGMED